MENNKSTDYKIAAVVVTYNRLGLLKECVYALRNQTRKLEEIIVVDNSSTDGTLEWLNNQNDLTVITQPNLGSSGGQHTGIKTAYEKGHDWIWCMDDDSIAENNSLEMLSKYFDNKQYFAISPVVKNKNGTLCSDHRGIFDFKKISNKRIQLPLEKKEYEKPIVEIDFVSFVGCLLNILAIEKYGLPRIDFFLHHDDVEYSLRLNAFGKALLVTSSTIVHFDETKSNYLVKKRFLWKTSFRMPYEKFWLSYFSNRNYIWLLKKKSVNAFSFYLRLINHQFLTLRRIMLYDDHKIKRIEMVIKSTLRGLNNIFDNTEPKKILYNQK